MYKEVNMNIMDKVFFNNLAKSAAMFGLMLAPLMQSNADNFGQKAIQFKQNAMQFGQGFRQNMQNTMQNFKNQIGGQQFNTNLNRFVPMTPQNWQKKFPHLSISEATNVLSSHREALQNKALGMMNPASAKDLQIQENIDAIAHGKGFGMMTKESLSAKVAGSARNLQNKMNAKFDNWSREIKQVQQKALSKVNREFKEIKSLSPNLKEAIKDVQKGFKTDATNIQDSLKKIANYVEKSAYHIQEGMKKQAKDLGKIKNIFGYGNDMFKAGLNSLNHGNLSLAKEQFSRGLLRTTTALEGLKDVIPQRYTDMQIAKDMIKSMKAPAKTAAISAGKTLAKTGAMGAFATVYAALLMENSGVHK